MATFKPVAEARRPIRSLGTAGRNLLGYQRPDSSCGSDDQDYDDWSREVRAALKSRSRISASPAGRAAISSPSPLQIPSSPAQAAKVGAEAKREVWNLEDEVLPLNRFPSMQGGRYSGRLDHVLESDSRGVPESRASIQDMGDRSKHGPVAQERACGDGKARASAYFEDLISFLEMNGLPEAYALALAANGIEDLSQLLTMGEEELDRAITRSDLDAMDEILLRDALRGVRARD